MANRERTTGRPTSSNGASSFHLRWELPGRPLAAVEATFEVVTPPAVPALYFWALQANFHRRGRSMGAAHFGLQHHPRYPGSGAVNWGGYHDRSRGGGELSGTQSSLPSALGNANTSDYPWQPGTAYRFRIASSGPGWWRGSITDLTSGVETIVRDLRVEADTLATPMVWSEVFADCDHPSAVVRWSDLTALGVDGAKLRPSAVTTSYQTVDNGGCSNTDIRSLGDGRFEQITSTTRQVGHGVRLVA